MTKTKKTVIKWIKKECQSKGYNFVEYEHGAKAHDFVVVEVWGIRLRVHVASTPKCGPDDAAKKAVFSLRKKVLGLRQKIIDGKYRAARK